MTALFCYTNYNGKLIPIAIYLGKASNNGSSVAQILSFIRRNYSNNRPILENSKIKSIAIHPGNTLYLLELDLKVIRGPGLFFSYETKYHNTKI